MENLETKDLLEFYVYPNLNMEEVLREISPELEFTDKGEYLEGTCPSCKERKKAFVYKNSFIIKCNRRNNCNYSKHIWSYVQEIMGLSKQETLFELARFSRQEHLLDKNKNYNFRDLEEIQKKSDILEKATEFFKEKLFSEEGKEILDYLTTKRKYTLEEIRKSDLGFFIGRKETIEYLVKRGHREEEIIKIFTYIDYKTDYKLILPYRDSMGRIISIWGRLTVPLKEGRKYLPFTEASKNIPFNLDKSKNQEKIYFVEGYLDSIIANSKGIKGVISPGGASLSDMQLKEV